MESREAKHLEDWQADKAKEAAALAASSSGARGSRTSSPLLLQPR